MDELTFRYAKEEDCSLILSFIKGLAKLAYISPPFYYSSECVTIIG
ncbi:MAG: hypothetical protein IJM08_04235 [Firmicutes bacterium]|nr:hypothetical protein [Bacillota bacterium]